MQPHDDIDGFETPAPAESADLEALVRKFQKELNSGLIALVLLAVLDRAGDELYGYQIAKQLQGAADGEGAPVKQGALYPVLRTLSAQGLLTSRVVPSVAGPPRRYYRITELGRATLARWLGIWRRTRGFVEQTTEGVAPIDPRTEK
ncbi:MAG: PadR family transcriptional regulator [Pseudomonadota bacterium]